MIKDIQVVVCNRCAKQIGDPMDSAYLTLSSTTPVSWRTGTHLNRFVYKLVPGKPSHFCGLDCLRSFAENTAME